MMLHRHFENQKEQNITTLNDVTPKPVDNLFAVSKNEELFEETDYRPRRGRRRKED